jgi:ParB/RepB/Spo0J family partition protein
MRLREHESVKTKYDAFRIDPRHLKVTDGYNVRDFTTPHAIEALATLKESIREEGGVIVPLEVRMQGDAVHVVSGHRRLRAVMELIAEGVEIETVPAVVEPKTTNDAERILRLVLHNSGEPLSMLEKSEVVRRLINMGWSREKIASRLGYKTPQSIANFELLISAPEAIREAVRQGDVSPSTAVELVRQSGDAAPERLKEIKVAAAKRGKAKASVRDTRPAGNADPAIVEIRNMRRLAEHEAASAPSDDMARLDKVVATLIDMERRGVSATTMARAFGTRKGSELAAAADWFYEFCDALRQEDAA